MATHLAAVSPAKGQPFEVQARPTPKPGPGELLIAVKSVALNPADAIMRAHGLFIPTYPAVVGFDMSGLVLEVGDNVPADSFRPGVTRIAAYAAVHWRGYNSDYGVFQERCLVPWQHAAPLPDEGLSWNHAATLPVAAQVPLNAWDFMKFPRLGQSTTSATISGSTASAGAEQEKQGREALLIWGASSSVGSMGVQMARLMREDPNSSIAAVYATAGSTNHDYVASLGADRVFDYKSPEVVDAIISAAKEDKLVIRHCFLAMGQLTACQDVLKAFVDQGLGEGEATTAKIVSAPRIPSDSKDVDGIEIMFVQPSAVEEERLQQFQYWMGTWLRENLANATVRPSPEPTVVGKGLEAINVGLDKLLQGISCTKLVVEIDS